MRGLAGFLGLCCAAGSAGAAPPAALRAEQILPETAAELVIGGPDAIGGIGDWYLANDVVEVIVDDPSRAYATLPHGGTIVDAGLRDRRDEDQFARLFPLVNLGQRVFVGYHAIRAELDADAGWARLVVSSQRRMDSLPRGEGLARRLDWLVPEPAALRDVVVETEYAVFRGEPFVHITTTLRNEGDAPAPVFSYGDVWMRGGRSMRGFVGNALAPEQSRGFHHVNFDPDNLFASSAALAAFTHVSVPGVRQFPPIAYAIFSPERAAEGLVQFGVTGQHVHLINAFLGDPDWRELGVLRLARATFGALGPGEAWSYRRRLLVTGRADAASTTDVIFPLLGLAEAQSGIEGRVEPAGLVAVVQVDAAAGHPVTQIEVAGEGPAAGRYRAVLPPGRYTLRFRAPQRPERRAEVVVGQGFSALPTQRFEEPGWLRFAPAFADGGPGRIALRGLGGTATPLFQPELLDFRLDGRRVSSGSESSQLFFAGAAGDPERVAIPPGRYQLSASRGLEWSAQQLEVEVPEAGAEVAVPPFALRREVLLPGYLSADLHVHAQASDDSAMPNEARLASFVAEGVDVIVASDHDNVADFGPALRRLGLGDRIRVVQGVEATNSGPSPQAPWTLGHSNAWPIAYAPFAHRRGAPPVQNRSLAELYAGLRREHGARVVQLNHPRADRPDKIYAGAFFTHLGERGEPFRPELAIDAEPNRLLLATAADGRTRGIDFDAMEVMNGDTWVQYLLVRRDWYSLLRQGYRRTGTANSDSHGPDELAGYPRSYVRLAGAAWDAAAFDAAIREGRLFGSNGPLIRSFSANGAGMGDLVGAEAGRLRVELAVEAAPWIPVDEVRLLVNGEPLRVWRELPTEGLVRLERREQLALAADAFLTLEAGAPLDAEPVAWAASHPGVYADALAPGFVPQAFSNPIFVDVDGNGRFDPPGLAPPPREWSLAAGFSAAAALGFGALVFWRRRRGRAG